VTDLWGLADYPALARRLAPAADALVDAVRPLVGRRVLDVAAGTGNVAVPAAAAGADVVACDSSPGMVRLGRERTGDAVRWYEADAEDLPVSDGSVDVVLSAFGLIFAPRPEVAVAQARRVLVPAGTLALTAWTADGFMATMTRVMVDFLPANDDAPNGPPAPDPVGWGLEREARTRLGAGFDDVRIQPRTLPWRFDSGAAMTAFMRAHSPMHAAAAYAVGDRADQMFAAVEKLAAPHGGPVLIDAEYLLITARAS